MDKPTSGLAAYVTDKRVNLSRVSKKTGISYQALLDSLSLNNRQRDLRAGEYFQICAFLNLDPLMFVNDENFKRSE